jgi:RNA polymerase sigma-70 factor (ECF subfamily)
LQTLDWQVIVKQHGPIVWQTAYRLLGNYADTADCFQETFVCALEVSRRQQVRNFPALLSRLATARAIDQLRQRIRRPRANTEPADLAAVPSCNPDPAQQLETGELAAKLRKAIAQLPKEQAEIFCLRYLNGMSYRLIAKQLGIRTSAAGVSLHRARAKLSRLVGTP